MHQWIKKPANYGDKRFRPDDVGKVSQTWPPDDDGLLSQRHGGRDDGHTIMPPESRSEYRKSPENDDPMEGISMSYPPPGPSDKFGYSHPTDEDQRKSDLFPQRGFDMRQPRDTGPINTGYRGQDARDNSKEREAGMYNRQQFGEEPWMVDPPSSRGPSQPVHGREPTDFQPYRQDEMHETTGRRD